MFSLNLLLLIQIIQMIIMFQNKLVHMVHQMLLIIYNQLYLSKYPNLLFYIFIKMNFLYNDYFLKIHLLKLHLNYNLMGRDQFLKQWNNHIQDIYLFCMKVFQLHIVSQIQEDFKNSDLYFTDYKRLINSLNYLM